MENVNKFEKALPELRKLIITLKRLDGEEDAHEEEIERYDIEVAHKLINKLLKLVRVLEVNEGMKMVQSIKALYRLLENSIEMQKFKCNHSKLQTYIHLFIRAPDGLNRILPVFHRDIENLIEQMEDIAESLLETPIDHHSRYESESKHTDFENLVVKLGRHNKYYCNFSRKYMKLRVYVHRMFCEQHFLSGRLLEAHNYLSGKTNYFLEDDVGRVEDDATIMMLVHNNGEDMKEILRNSLKEVMDSRGLQDPLTRRNETIMLIPKIKKLMKCLKKIKQLLKWFEKLKVTATLKFIRLVDLHLHVVKQELEIEDT